MNTALNWKEIAALVEAIRGQVEDLFVERIVVPERPRFPEGYIKGEWLVRLTGKKRERALLFSVRPRRPYLALCEGKGLKAAAHATHSPFSQALGKYLKGARLMRVEALPRERVVAMWFSGEDSRSSSPGIGLLLSLIPALPEAFLVQRKQAGPLESAESGQGWPILARSRTIRDESKVTEQYIPPDGSKAPEDLKVRSELVESAETYTRFIEKDLEREAFELRLANAKRAIRESLKKVRDRIRQCETAIQEAARESDWASFGHLLKSVLHDPPPIREGHREIPGYLDDESMDASQTIRIPSDPKLNPQQQVEKFYQLARRKKRRIEEAQLRLSGFQETLDRLEKADQQSVEPFQWKELVQLEQKAGVPTVGARGGMESERKAKKGPAWLGRTFISKDGLSILVGRSRDENLELTFKVARGNDMWMHLRGRPGVHTLIPTQPGKSVPLETLLDAAALTIFYSGGEKWGKTEVDYTFKKHVRRIKDSTEASYTHNKTLIVEPDPVRLKRLLGS